MIRRGSESDKSEAAVVASSEKRTAFPLVPVPLDYVDESPQEALIVQLVSEPRTDRSQRRPAMVAFHDLANADHRRQEPGLTANAPLPIEVGKLASGVLAIHSALRSIARRNRT